MFEPFSRGYYLGRLRVEPHDGDRAVMERGQHERANEQVYAEDVGVERLDYPLVMKLDTAHFAVHGADEVPTDTLAVPESLLESTRVRDPPKWREVLLAKEQFARRLFDFGAV